jgi:hypothetical protein
MSWKSQIVSESKPLPPRLLIYGPAGIGKTSFAASLPKPILLDYDHGADEVRVDRIAGPTRWADMLNTIGLIVSSPGEYRTLAIDTVDVLEPLAVEHVLASEKKRDINTDFKWGAGHALVLGLWRQLFTELDRARDAGLCVCLLGHATTRTIPDPQFGEYDQYTSRLGRKLWDQTKAWCDVVGFANFDAALHEGTNHDRIIVTGERRLYTTRGSGFEAKNRFGIDAPLPLSWGALSAAIERHRGVSDAIEAEIRSLASGSAELRERAEQFIKVANRDTAQLLEVRAALIEKLNAEGSVAK